MAATAKAQRQETIVAAIAAILNRGEPTRFRYEATCRYGLRSALILRGMKWATADDRAAEIINLAFRRLAVSRPPWWWGQPEYVHEEQRTHCANSVCGNLIERETLRPSLYCSELCRCAAKARRHRQDHLVEAAAYQRAFRAQFRAAQPERPCEECNRRFQPSFSQQTGKSGQLTRFCSIKCRNRANARKGGQRSKRDFSTRTLDVLT